MACAMDPEVMAMVQQLWRYLQNHPDACDTSMGISRWWVNGDPAVMLDVVEAALSWMAAQGLVEALHAADGRTLYRAIKGPSDVNALMAAAAPAARAAMASGAKRPPRSVH
jgi:hypothetical protein